MALILAAETVTGGTALFNGDTDNSVTNYNNAHNGSPGGNVYAANNDTTPVGQVNSPGGGLGGADAFAVRRFAHVFAIPAGVTSLATAVLNMFFYTPVMATPQYIYILDSEGDIAPTGVVLADFGQMLLHTTEWGKIHSNDLGAGAYREITLNALAITAILAAAGGFIYFTVRTHDDINAIMPTTGENQYFMTPSGDGTNPAKLLLTWSGRTSCHPVIH